MTSATKPILDYASPFPRGKRVRLPAKSILRVSTSRGADGSRIVEIVETLAGKAEAIGAIAFACFILVILLVPMVDGLQWARDHGWSTKHFPFSLAVLFVIELALMIAVINNTWRKTIVEASLQRLRIRFASPLHTRLVDWPAESVMAATVEPLKLKPAQQARGSDALRLHELLLQSFHGQAIHLFAGHDFGELHDLASLLSEVMDLRHGPASVARAAANPGDAGANYGQP